MIIFHADTFYIRITIIDAIKNTKQRHRFVHYNLDQLLEIMSGDARSGNANKISKGLEFLTFSRYRSKGFQTVIRCNRSHKQRQSLSNRTSYLNRTLAPSSWSARPSDALYRFRPRTLPFKTVAPGSLQTYLLFTMYS
jgi:hypothetical protein